MPNADKMLEVAASRAEELAAPGLEPRPRRKVAVLACMDTRIDLFPMLGLERGDAHIIRNAGGLVTEDAIRSLSASQRLLGTEEIVLIHHTDCGMLTFTDPQFRDQVEADTGVRPTWSAEAFDDLEADVRRSARRITSSPFLPHTDSVRGFVFDVATGRLNEVALDG